MSGIAAIIHFDGQPASHELIARVTAAMAYRGPDGISHFVERSASLGQCRFETTGTGGALPLSSIDGTATLVFDGYLTHPEELHAELASRGCLLRDTTDAELVLAAWQCWGNDCPRHIDGEYAFIVWDSRQQAAFLARDHQGLRPLLFAWNGRTLVAASDIGAVLAALPNEPEPDRRCLAEFMAMRLSSLERTVWQGVERVLPASWLRFDGSGRTGSGYWTVPSEVTICHRSEQDYVAHYRDVLAECVRRSSRSHLPVAIEASGGLDSSAVLAVAQGLHSANALQAPSFKAYTMAGPIGSDADESAYVRDLARHLGVPIAPCPLFYPDEAWFRAETELTRDLAAYPNTAMTILMERQMALDGCRVALSGQGGDHWLWGTDIAYFELLSKRDWQQLRHQLAADRRDYGLRTAIFKLYRYGLVPLLPPGLRHRYRLATGREGRADRQGYYWLAPDLAGDLQLRDREWAQRVVYQYHRHYKHEKWSQPFIQRITESFTRQKARNGIEPRNPMFARAFIEFSAQTPEHLRKRGATHKYIHREAMAGRLPESIRGRDTKGEFSITSDRHLPMLEQAFTRSIPAGGQDLIDPAGLARLWSSFCNAAIDERSYWELWGIYLVHLLVASHRR